MGMPAIRRVLLIVVAMVFASMSAAVAVPGTTATAQDPPTGVVPVMPVRLADWSAVAGFGSSRCVAVSAAGAPAGAQGVLVNVASVNPPTQGNAVVFPSDGTASPVAPEGTSVTFEPGQTVASAAFAKVGDDGKVCLYSQAWAASRVLMDVSGFAMPGSGVTLQSSQRLLDTRKQASGLAAREPREVQVGGKVGVPTDAKAAVVTVTAVMPGGTGHLRVFPATGDQSVPHVATLHYAPGTTKSSTAVVPLGNGGKIGLYSDTDAPVQLVVDVTGYVSADAQVYRSIDPVRVLDTRPTAPAAQRTVSTLRARQPVAFDVAATGLAPGASAVVLNVTAVGPNSVGNLRVYPDDDGTGATAPPNASQINYIAGRNISNLVMVKVPADGKIMLYSDQPSGGTVDVNVDLVGYVVDDCSTCTSPPGPSNTGVPAGTNLKVVDGPGSAPAGTVWYNNTLKVMQDGTVLDGLDVRGLVRIEAKNVVIKNSRITGRYLSSSLSLVYVDGSKYSVTIQDSELYAAEPSPWVCGIIGYNFTLERVNIHDVIDQVHVTGGNVVVRDSWLHDNLHYVNDPNLNGGPSHDDNVQLQQGTGITLVHNTMEGSHNAAVQVTQDTGKVGNVRIERNYVSHGACSLNLAQKTRGALEGFTIMGNQFTRTQVYSGCALIVDTPSIPLLTLGGNTWTDGTAVKVTPR